MGKASRLHKVLVFDRKLAQEVDAAQAFWTAPNAATWAVYNQHCKHLYNVQPAHPDVGARTAMAAARGVCRRRCRRCSCWWAACRP